MREGQRDRGTEGGGRREKNRRMEEERGGRSGEEGGWDEWRGGRVGRVERREGGMEGGRNRGTESYMYLSQ